MEIAEKNDESNKNGALYFINCWARFLRLPSLFAELILFIIWVFLLKKFDNIEKLGDFLSYTLRYLNLMKFTKIISQLLLMRRDRNSSKNNWCMLAVLVSVVAFVLGMGKLMERSNEEVK